MMHLRCCSALRYSLQSKSLIVSRARWTRLCTVVSQVHQDPLQPLPICGHEQHPDQVMYFICHTASDCMDTSQTHYHEQRRMPGASHSSML